MPKICVLGLGYIGLPTSVIFARYGFQVVGVDINPVIVEKINCGETHIIEPNLNSQLKVVLKNKSFIARTSPVEADIFIVAVPTPYIVGENGIFNPDTSMIFKAIKSISKVIKKNNLIILESTSPIGTTEKIYQFIHEKTGFTSDEVKFAYCPERVLPGNIFNELVNNDRVIGGLTLDATNQARNIYKQICNGDLHLTNAKTAEMVKLTENSYRDINIAFANEISIICDEINIDVNELIKLSNQHPRVNILNPGCGVGGHCIAIDPWFIASQFPDITPLIQQARRVNLKKTQWTINKIKKIAKSFYNKNGKPPTLGCLGLTYKPNIDDVRESPALKITQELIKDNYKLLVSEPNLLKYKELKLHHYEEVIKKSDLIFILVAHKEFKLIKSDDKKIYDFCGIT